MLDITDSMLHNLALTATSDIPPTLLFPIFVFSSKFLVTHSSKASTRLSRTSFCIPARKHIRTLSPPGGTVGGTTGRMMKPFCSRKAERACGVGVRRPMIEDGVMDDTVGGRWRMRGGVRESRGARIEYRYPVKAKRLIRRYEWQKVQIISQR